MHDTLQQRCEQAFADHVEALFEQARARGIANLGAVNLKYQVLKAPYIELLYCAADDDLIAKLKPMICAALARREQFRQLPKPPWAPDLPLSFEACEKLQNSGSSRMRRVGNFGMSLLMSQWDEAHPAFDQYCCEGKKVWREDETLDGWAELLERMDAGIMHRGAVPRIKGRPGV
jgi:hypothetical protein